MAAISKTLAGRETGRKTKIEGFGGVEGLAEMDIKLETGRFQGLLRGVSYGATIGIRSPLSPKP